MIRMKSGVYGAKDNMKRPSDGPFSLPDKEEERLVKRGVAEYVFDHPTKPADDGEPDGPDIPKYDVGMTDKQLRGIAAYFCVDVSAAKRKQDIVDILDRHFAANEEDDTAPDGDGDDIPDGGDDPDAPVLGAEDPVV